jgi:DNA-binding transcriptional LysR family regulator
MESKWLEDFVTLSETRSFSRAAELRSVTQPAFSRRIQALEAWIGTPLIDRTSYPTKPTPAGQVFHEQAIEMLGQINGVRTLLKGKHSAGANTLSFAVPHTLAITFFPQWLTELEHGFKQKISTKLSAFNVHDAVLQLVDGGTRACPFTLTRSVMTHCVLALSTCALIANTTKAAPSLNCQEPKPRQCLF